MKSFFQPHKVIKISNKTFENLTWEELALMIEADSSISPNGNEYFASCALDEFLHNTKLIRDDLKELQQEILSNIYIDVDGSKNKEINTEYLRYLANRLRAGNKIST